MRSGKEEGSGYYEPRDWYPYDKAMELLEGKGLGGIYWIRIARGTVHYRKEESPVIYIGASEKNIRRRLKAHLEKRDKQGICIMEKAPPSELEVGFEILLDPAVVHSREQALLGAFQDEYGELPKCNSLRLR